MNEKEQKETKAEEERIRENGQVTREENGKRATREKAWEIVLAHGAPWAGVAVEGPVRNWSGFAVY